MSSRPQTMLQVSELQQQKLVQGERSLADANEQVVAAYQLPTLIMLQIEFTNSVIENLVEEAKGAAHELAEYSHKVASLQLVFVTLGVLIDFVHFRRV